MVWPAIIGGLASIGSALIARGGQKKGGGGGGGGPESYLDQLPGIGKQYLDPYIQRGNTAQDMASSQYAKMAQDPSSFVNQLMASYKPSTGYDFRKQAALEAARNSAASGGLSGTSFDQKQQAAMVNSLLGNDMQQWLDNVLGVHGAGLAGQQHVGNMGFSASNNLADMLATALSEKADIAGMRERQAMSNNSGIMGLLSHGMGMLGGGLGGLVGGGGGGNVVGKMGSTPGVVSGSVPGRNSMWTPNLGVSPYKSSLPSSSSYGKFK